MEGFSQKVFFYTWWILQYVVLNVTDSMTHLLDKNIPSFYLKCIEYYQKFLRISAPEPSSTRDIRGQILWHNHLIKFNGKSLDFKHWAQCGLMTIDDGLQDFKLCPIKIKEKLRITSNFIFEFEILRKAIPKKWIESLVDANVTQHFFSTVAWILTTVEDAGRFGP